MREHFCKISTLQRKEKYQPTFNLPVPVILQTNLVSQLCLTGIVGLVALVLSFIGYVIGIREAAEFSTGNAVITALIVAVVAFVINLIAGGVANLL